MSAASGTIAGIVAYHPDEDELARLVARVAPDVLAVTVFANSPLDDAMKARLGEGPAAAEVIGSGANVGLGEAYNRLLARAEAAGARFLLLLDQDSLPAPSMVPRLAEAHAALRAAGERPALVGPRPVGPDGVPLKIPALPGRAAVSGAVPVAFAISSGSLIDVEAARAVGPFRADFFIDGIDLEWCMRAGHLGHSTWVAEAVTMDHRLGRGVIRVAGLRLADQPPRRLYSYIRNQIAMLRLAHVPLGHKLRFVLSLPARVAIYLARSGFSRDCARALGNGVRDGVANRLGPPDRALDPIFRKSLTRNSPPPHAGDLCTERTRTPLPLGGRGDSAKRPSGDGGVDGSRAGVRDFAARTVRSLRTVLRAAALRTSEPLVGRQELVGAVPGREGARYSLQVPDRLGPYLAVRGRLQIAGWVLDLDRGEPLRWRARVGGRLVAAEPQARPELVAAFSGLCRLPVACGGVIEVAVRPGPSFLVIEAETAPGKWRPLFQAVAIGMYPRRASGSHAAGSETARAATPQASPSVTVLVVGPDGEPSAATIASLAAQTMPALQVVRIALGDAGGFGEALASARGEFVLPLRAGDELRPDALAALTEAADPRTDLVYADEESGSEAQRYPVYKPGWSPDTLEAYDYLGAPALYRTAHARHLPADNAYDLALRFTERTERIRHLPVVLCRGLRAPTDPVMDGAARAAALAGRLARTQRRGTVEPLAPGLPCLVATVSPPDPAPLVSVVMPTAGREVEIGGRQIDLVVNCVRSIRERSTYRNVEFVVVANPDLPAAKRGILEELCCRVVVYGDPVFNIARKVNLGAASASGEYLVLMNDDIEVVAPDWIEHLLAQAAKPHVGVVGSRLLYPDGTIQHAGVVFLRGIPFHVRRAYPGGERGYVFSTAAPRNYLAVTGACMMTRAELFRRAGGETEALGLGFDDVDYCLKVRELGLHVVYEPASVLVHFESVSRDAKVDPAALAYLRERWGAATASDPFYNAAAFSLTPPAFEPFPRS